MFKRKVNEITSRLDYFEARDYFKGLGIDIDSLGFPSMEYAYALEKIFLNIAERYRVWFENIKTMPLRDGGDINMVTWGLYLTQPCGSSPCGSSLVEGRWLPGGVSEYDFEIRKGKLTCDLIRPQETLIFKSYY